MTGDVPVESLPIAVALLDGDRLCTTNEEFARLVRVPIGQLVDRPLSGLFGPEETRWLTGRPEGVAWTELAGVAEDGSPFLLSAWAHAPDPTGRRTLLAVPAGPPRVLAGVQDGDLAAGPLPTHPWERAGLDRVLSHDVRGALRGVSGFLSLLGRELAGAQEDAADYHATATAAAGRADVMVERIVHLLRLDLRPLQLQPVVLGGVVEAATRRSAEQGAVPRIELGSLPTVWGDAALLTECVGELLTNAQKFSGGAATVAVTTSRTAGPWVYVSITDDGPGIEPQFVEEAFTLFRLLQPKGKFPGVGMGLPVARRIAEVHGGRLWIEPGEGPGVTVSLRLLVAT
jgi:hypothetical protein